MIRRNNFDEIIQLLGMNVAYIATIRSQIKISWD